MAVVHDSFAGARIYLDPDKNIMIVGIESHHLKLFTVTLQDFVRQKFGVEVEVYFEQQAPVGRWHEIQCTD